MSVKYRFQVGYRQILDDKGVTSIPDGAAAFLGLILVEVRVIPVSLG
jgi:hypothetical protein